MQRINQIFALVLAFLVATPAFAAKDDVNYLDLATLLIRDKNYDRASAILSQVNPAKEKKKNLARLYTLRGLVRLHQSLYKQSADDFALAIKSGQEDPIIHVYLGQAYYYAREYDKSLKAFKKAPEKTNAIPGTYIMRSEAYSNLERNEEAWDVLTQGLKRHPNYIEIVRRKANFAIKLGLFQVGTALSEIYLEQGEGSYQDYLAVGNALYRSSNNREALSFLEIARLRYPLQPEVSVELARVYKSEELYRTAAGLLEQAALRGRQELFSESAELFRQTGELYQALSINGRIAKSKERLRQRLGILLELRQYELIATMNQDLVRVGLLKDESIRYAVAYAFFKTGDYSKATSLIDGLRDPSLFKQATELRKAMQDCRKARWKC